MELCRAAVVTGATTLLDIFYREIGRGRRFMRNGRCTLRYTVREQSSLPLDVEHYFQKRSKIMAGFGLGICAEFLSLK